MVLAYKASLKAWFLWAPVDSALGGFCLTVLPWSTACSAGLKAKQVGAAPASQPGRAVLQARTRPLLRSLYAGRDVSS